MGTPSGGSSSTGKFSAMGSNQTRELRRLTIRELEEITDKFERLIGQGAYGKVYKGEFDNGEEVAVKVLHGNMVATNGDEFQHEFDNLMMLNHPNIVRLVGYCYEIQHQHMDFQGRTVLAETTCRALCFEYMHTGSLQGQLYDESHGLDWKTRYKIIKGACEGLKYLHEGNGLRKPIYHLDLKPDNILLDENMTPKLADFGLSKLCDAEQTRVTQDALGTFGYMPVEYLCQRLVSNKVDIFSLGVIITKIIAGPTGQTRSAEMSNQKFLDQVHENWRSRLEATCTSMKVLEAYCEQVNICTEIGLSCMEYNRHNRPSIVDIIDRLDETETMIEKAISWSVNSLLSGPVNSQREKDDDPVKIEAFARNKSIQVTEMCEEFPILVRVTAAPWHAKEMPCIGVDVVFAFNVKMTYIREPLTLLVKNISPNDRLSILFWGFSGIEHVMELTYMSDHGRNIALLKINELYERHSRVTKTYNGPVLPEAAQILRQRGVEESGSRVGCILHVWDGKMVPEIHEQDISQVFPVQTIGFGDAHNDMIHIANMTDGTFERCSYKDIDSGFNNILRLLSGGITSAKQRPVSKITLQSEEGVTISSIASGGHRNLVSSDKQSATVFPHIINGGERKSFIVYLTVPQRKEKLVTIGGRYKTKELVGTDVVVLRPRRKCLPDEVVIHPKVTAELLRILLKEGLAKGDYVLSRNGLRLLVDEINNSDEARAAPEEIRSQFEEEVAELMDHEEREAKRLSGARFISDQFSGVPEFMLPSLNGLQLSILSGDPEMERLIGAVASDRFSGVYSHSMLSSLNGHQLLRSTSTGTQRRADAQTNFVKIQAFGRSKGIISGGSSEFPVLLRVTVAQWRRRWEMPNDGVDVVALLDISGDMLGRRLDRVKQAMMIVIDKLGPNDRLSIVSFQTHKLRLMELTYMSDDHDHARDAARFKITQLRASSRRPMGDIARAALQEGAQILRDRAAKESSPRPGCMMLLSDGQHPDIVHIRISPEFPVHTFGLGDDHRPKVMKYIADMTSGTYSYVGPGVSNIKHAIALFITGFTSIAVRSIKITLNAHNDCFISSIESGNYIHNVESHKSGTITIDHIYAGEQKDFIVNIRVGSGTKKLMTISGYWKGFKGKHYFHEIGMSVTRPWLSKDDLAIHPDVAAELTRIQLQKGVMDMLERQGLTNRGLQELWRKIKHSEEGRGTPEETLSSLTIEVAEMKRDISGMPYTLSWLSCHKWQRVTTMGIPSDCAFRTIGQYYDDEDTNLVKVESFTRSKAIPSDGPCNKFPVLVRVMAAPRQKAEEMPQAGVDVVFVLDASAGMRGEKLVRMKVAMMVVIGMLRAEDRLSIVSFNTYENRLTRLTYMTNHGQDVARLRISKLVAGGQGDIAAALREGAEILRWREAESSCRLGCMVLLSDCKNYEIFETEIRSEFPVHTFGLGTDHNPRMMKYIADVTSGTYSFVYHDIGMTNDALRLFITGLTSVAAMSIKITLMTNEGITISSIESGGYVNHVKSNEFGTIDIDNIYAGEQKDFIVYLIVPEGKKELMAIGGRYLSHDTVKHLVYTDVFLRRPHEEGLPDDLAIHPEVAAELVKSMLEKGISAMLDNGPSIVDLQQLWEKIMDTEEARGMQEETLSGLSMDVAEMKRDIENPEEHRKSGLAYMLSWLTSRKWQRATIKGTASMYDALQKTWQDGDEREPLSH